MISAFSLCNLVGKKLNASLLEILPFPLIKAVKASYAVAIWPVIVPKTKTEALSTQISKTKHPRSKTKHPNLENEDPKTRKRST